MMEKKKSEAGATFKIGAICLAFLIIGYQTALFIQRAAVLKIEANRDRPDTVYVIEGTEDYSPGESHPAGAAHKKYLRSDSPHSERVEAVRKASRRVESFRFNPNTASVEELQRLGFSEKQALAIDNYRSKGGRFRRRPDFAKSFVVADSVYKRLEKYIDIPRTDINKADSAALDDLPGIGGYFARKILEYRERLGGFSYPEQLMDIYHFDQSKYDALKDLIYCSPPKEYRLWELDAKTLRSHPYIRSYDCAKAIVLYRSNTPADSLKVSDLGRYGILDAENAAKLARCRIAAPPRRLPNGADDDPE